MLLSVKNGQTGLVIRAKLRQGSTGTNPGNGLTALTGATSGLVIGTIADNEATSTAYTSAGSTVDTIATLGTYAAPTAGHCRLREVDATNHPGVYEFQFENSRFAVANAKHLLVSVSGVSGMADCDFLVPLTTVDPYVSGGKAPATVATGDDADAVSIKATIGAAGAGLTAIGPVTVGGYAGGQSPLQPTVAGRTLDVAATGEAGVDLSNIKQATGATTLTNITVPTVTDVTNGVTVGGYASGQAPTITVQGDSIVGADNS
jgi:hypothetical protein